MAADPRLLVGAGTVVTPDQVDRAVAAGAAFIVSPGFNPAVVRRCQELNVPVFPGVATATEIMPRSRPGSRWSSSSPPSPRRGGDAQGAGRALPRCPVHPDRRHHRRPPAGYLAQPSVLAVGGSWMVAPELIAAGDWDEISRLTAEAVTLAAARRQERTADCGCAPGGRVPLRRRLAG